MNTRHIPHPIPYQGSKRKLAPRILAHVARKEHSTLYEPFAGSAAISIAALRLGLVERVVLGESLQPLAELWSLILTQPDRVSMEYSKIWHGQKENDTRYFNRVRDEFNATQDPVRLLYLLARCVKNAPRFNSEGYFNQSADKRRLGMRPQKMTEQIYGVANLMHGRATVMAADFADTIAEARQTDLVYLDPPWQGTSEGRDKRYHAGLDRDRLEQVLADLVQRDVPFLLSYDGNLAGKTYGAPLDSALALTRLELQAGRSSQATLNGRNEYTVESLYLSPAIKTQGLSRQPELQLTV